MQVDTNVAESDIGRIQLGQPATFTVDAYPGLAFEGRVKQIRQAPINVQNVITYDAVIQVANPDLKLFPGMTANVTILTRHSENAVKLPNAALRVTLPPAMLEGPATPNRPAAAGNWAVVYVTGNNSKGHAVSVKTGITDGNFTEVQQGELRAGQTVIVGVSMPEAQPSRVAPVPGPGRF